MDKGLLQRYSTRPDSGADPALLEFESVEDLGCFGMLRGGHRDRSVMLELRKRSGNCLAIAYSWIESIEYDPSSGIRIHAGPALVTIQGENLNADNGSGRRLFEGLTRHRVAWVLETPRSHLASGDMCAVDTIRW